MTTALTDKERREAEQSLADDCHTMMTKAEATTYLARQCVFERAYRRRSEAALAEYSAEVERLSDRVRVALAILGDERLQPTFAIEGARRALSPTAAPIPEDDQ